MYVHCFPPLFCLPLPSVLFLSPPPVWLLHTASLLPTLLHISQLQISPRKCLVLEGNSCSFQTSNYPLQQPHRLFTVRVEGANPQLFSPASRPPFAMSTRCTGRRQECILPDFTASSLQALFKTSCPLQFHHEQWSHWPPQVKQQSYRVCNHQGTSHLPQKCILKLCS